MLFKYNAKHVKGIFSEFRLDIDNCTKNQGKYYVKMDLGHGFIKLIEGLEKKEAQKEKDKIFKFLLKEIEEALAKDKKIFDLKLSLIRSSNII